MNLIAIALNGSSALKRCLLLVVFVEQTRMPPFMTIAPFCGPRREIVGRGLGLSPSLSPGLSTGTAAS